ncbi:MAG TPA: response regulator [Phycisphaerales bacterium]|nr:response regulator [Phycisphaerales bacterium]HIB50880.1 response regulator [Phycisphaerales bacterium]HIN83779.1 response regulator [Phycisphaerales bacterium]HIO52537.1 response regulator [Phycisphaerales bacterium]
MLRLENHKILIVDDDPDILESFDLAMRAEGATTITSEDGTEAVSAALKHNPDAVILDMMLPKRSGFLVLEELLSMETPPIVVMVTANEGKRHMAYAKTLGVAAYLIKPVGLDRLIDTVSCLLQEDKKNNE